MSAYNYGFNNAIKWQDADGMEPGDVDDPNKSNGQVRLYGNAEFTNTTLSDKGGTQDYAQGIVNYKDARLVPALNKDNEIVGYHVFDTTNEERGMPVLQITGTSLSDFKENYVNYMAAARLYYMSGEPSEGMKNISAGVENQDINMVLKGVAKENKAAWSDPVFVANFLISLGHASTGLIEKMPTKPTVAKSNSATIEHVYGNPKMTSAETRHWYNIQVEKLNIDVPHTRENAEILTNLRNELKKEAIAMMANEKAAVSLNVTDPIRPFKYYVDKYSRQGLTGEALWGKIINASKTPNQNVNRKFFQ